MRGTPSERFWAKVNKTFCCWEWQASKVKGGYGRFGDGHRLVLAHRWAFESERFPIPEGFDIDHLCRNRACVRPNHLAAVTHRENILRGEGFSAEHARQTYCKHGHEFTVENTHRPTRGGRQCRKCYRLSHNAGYAKRKKNAEEVIKKAREQMQQFPPPQPPQKAKGGKK